MALVSTRTLTAIAIVLIIVAGVGGYYSGSLAVPPKEVTTTVTSTREVTRTITSTATVTSTTTLAPGAPYTTTVTVTPPPTTVTVTSPTTVTRTVTTTVTATATPTPPPQPLAGQVLRVGVVQPLTGPYAYEAESGLYGMMLATEEINAAGGILGAKIELYVEDFGGDPKVAGSATEKLITVNKVHVIRGSYTSASMYVIAPIAEKYKIPVLTVGCSAKELTQQGWKYFFKTAPNSTAFNIVAVEFLRKVIEPELKLGRPLKVAILHDTGLVAVSDKDAFLEQQKRQAPDWQIVAIESYNVGTLDFKPIIDKLKAAQPDVVAISAFAGDGALLLKQSAEAGFKPAVWIGIGGGGTQAPKFIELGGDYCKYFFGGSEYWFDRQYPNPKALADFGKRFLERWGRPLDFQSWTGYAGMYMLKAVIEKYQKIDPEVIREGLATMKFYFDWVGELFFYPNGQMNSITTITQVLPATPQDSWSVKGLTFRTVYPAPYKAADPVFPWKVGG